jgi:hypothetical protein
MPIPSTSFTFTAAERKLLDKVKAQTGVQKTVVLRRLLAAYAAGLVVPGLPTVNPPIK